MADRDRDPFDDYDDQEDFLPFDARDEETGSSRGPLILAVVVVLLFLLGMVVWTLMSGRAQDAAPQVAADPAVAEDQVAAVDPALDPSVLDNTDQAPPLEVEPLEGAEDPLLGETETAPPVAAAAPVAPATRPAPPPPVAPRPAPPPPVAARPASPPPPPAARPSPPPPARVAEAPAPKPAPRPASPPPPPAATRPAPPPPPAAAPAASGSGGSYQAQLGSFQTRAAAETQLANYRSSGLTGPVSVVSANLGEKGTWFRIRATGFENRSEAVEFCRKASAAGAPCIPQSN